MANSGNAKGFYRKTEQPEQPGRGQRGGRAAGRETSGAARVADVMARAEASHARGSKTTEGKAFMLEPNQAKHTTADYAATDRDAGTGRAR